MRAMILAAGFGTRLWPLTADRTKPAIPFLNKPLIIYSVEYLSRFGIDEMVVNLHHQGDSVVRALGDGSNLGVKIHYSYEETILGTSGALDHARDWFQDDTFIVMNGKVITDLDLSAAMQIHRERHALATLILKRNSKRERFSKVFLDDQGRISGFGSYPSSTEDVPLMFTGIQIMEPEIFDYIPHGVFSHSTTDVYPKAIAAGDCIAAYIGDGVWYELSTLRRYLDISLEFLAQKGENVVLGSGSNISPEANVQNSILWENVYIAPEARLDNVIIGDGVTIPARMQLRDSAVVRREVCAEIERGEVLGENIVVPIN